MNDLMLMALVRDGDQDAFTELQNRHGAYVKSVCKNYLEVKSKGLHLQMRQGYQNLIDDISSEVWIAILEKAKSNKPIDDRGDTKSAFKKYLTIVTKNQTKKVIVKSTKNRSSEKERFYTTNNSFLSLEQVDETEFIDSKHDFYNEKEEFFYSEEISEILSGLSEKDKAIFSAYNKMGIVEGKTQKKIAEHLGCSLSSYQKKIKQIKNYMKEKLSREY